MKLKLNFNSELDFQNFCSQLFSAEFSSYQAIEGSGGDKGLDGIETDTAFQMFYSEPKNRIKSRYLFKINQDLNKLLDTIKEENLIIKRWIFVTPQDLTADLVLYLRNKTKDLGIECLGWGASKITELLGKHPHIKKAFPSVFPKDIEEELKELSSKINNLFNPKISDEGIEIVGDVDFIEQNNAIDREYRNKAQGAQNRYGASSATIVADRVLREEASRKKIDLRRRKEVSDKMYELLKKDIEVQFDEIIQEERNEFAKRGISGSGLENRAIGLVEIRKKGELEKLNLKYQKNNI